MIQNDADPEEYFAMNKGREKGDPEWVVSRSDLVPFLNATPREWLLDTGMKDTRSIRLGSLVDCLLLTPDRFTEWYVITPETYPAAGKKKGDPPTLKPWTMQANYCKDWVARESEGGKTVVTRAEVDEARVMADAMAGKPVEEWGGTVGDFIELSSTQTMVTADYVEPHTGMIVPIRALIDVAPHKGISPDSLWDLKSARDVAPEGWQRSVSAFGYDFQGWFYLLAFNAATGENRGKFGHLIVGNSHPYMTAVRQLSGESLKIGRRKFEFAMRRYCECVQNRSFPGYPDGVDVVEPTIWDSKKWGE